MRWGVGLKPLYEAGKGCLLPLRGAQVNNGYTRSLFVCFSSCKCFSDIKGTQTLPWPSMYNGKMFGPTVFVFSLGLFLCVMKCSFIRIVLITKPRFIIFLICTHSGFLPHLISENTPLNLPKWRTSDESNLFFPLLHSCVFFSLDGAATLLNHWSLECKAWSGIRFKLAPCCFSFRKQLYWSY